MSETYSEEGKSFERYDSEVRRMISVIEASRVRVLNNNTDAKRNRVPVPRVQSRNKIRLIKSQLFVHENNNFSSSQPSLLHLQSLEHNKFNEVNIVVDSHTEEDSTTTNYDFEHEGHEVCIKTTFFCIYMIQE